MTADAAAQGIREHGFPTARSRLVGEESHPPYKRPPPDEGALEGRRRGEDLEGHRRAGASSWCSARRIVSLDLERGGARTDDAGGDYAYEKVLLATGGRPAAGSRTRIADVIYFRTLDDYHKLRAAADRGASVRRDRRRLHRLRARGRAPHRTARARDDGLSRGGDRLASFFPRTSRSSSTATTTGRRVSTCGPQESVVSRPEAAASRSAPAACLDADVVVAGLGIEPRTELAAASPGSRSTTASSWTSSAASTAATDVFRRRRRRELPDVGARGVASGSSHEGPTRTRTARRSARTWRGAGKPYDHIPFFYSDLFRPRLRSGRRGRFAAPDRRALGGARAQGRRRLRRRREAAARLPALEHLGQGRRRNES